MLRKTLIGALALALTPALAFAAPAATMTMKDRGAVTHTVKPMKKAHTLKKVKAQKIRLIQKHRAMKAMRVTAHLKHRAPTHKI